MVCSKLASSSALCPWAGDALVSQRVWHSARVCVCVGVYEGSSNWLYMLKVRREAGLPFFLLLPSCFFWSSHGRDRSMCTPGAVDGSKRKSCCKPFFCLFCGGCSLAAIVTRASLEASLKWSYSLTKTLWFRNALMLVRWMLESLLSFGETSERFTCGF